MPKTPARSSKPVPKLNSPEPIDQDDERFSPGIEETPDTRDFAAYDGELNDWIARESLDSTTYRASLYRYSDNRNQQFLVNASSGSILSAHDVGIKYGSGEYRYVVTWKTEQGPKIKAFRINIAKEYDAMRAAAQPAPVAAQPAQGLSEALGIVQTVFSMLVPLIKAPAAPAAPQNNVAEMSMIANHKMMQDVMAQGLLQYVELQKTVRERLDDNNTDDQEEDEEDMNNETGDPIVDQMKALAVEWLPKILGDGLTGKVAAAAVKSLPEFKAITKDKARLAALLDVLEEKFGPDEINAACQRLNIRRPARDPMPQAAPAAA